MTHSIANIVNQYGYTRSASSSEAKGSDALISAVPINESAVAHQSKAIDTVELANRVESIRQAIQRNLEFSVDNNTGKQVIKVVDTDTGELVRQIPSDQILHVIAQVQKSLDGMSQGVLLDDKV
ncbi:MAG: flagellar protein FlaG [Candidatus Thiodiazotropha sp.]|jgi:flagellar protein FlaG